MTFLMPQSEALEFSSEDLNSTHSFQDAFFDESKDFNDYDDFNDFLSLPLSPTIPDYNGLASTSYEIVPDNKLKQEKEGLRLKLRVSNSISIGPGSSGSSPNDLSDDTEEVFNVEEFLNFPASNDYITIEESKQVAPSPAYSLSSYSPLHSSYSPGPSSNTCSPAPSSRSVSSGVSSSTSSCVSSSSGTSSSSSSSNVGQSAVKVGVSGDVTEIKPGNEVMITRDMAHSGKVYRYPSNAGPGKSVPGSTSNSARAQQGNGRAANKMPSFSEGGPHSKTGKVKRKISGSGSVPSSPKSLRKNTSQVCRVVPMEKPKETGIKEMVTVKPNKSVLKKYYEQADILVKTREKEIIEVEKKESASKLKQGAVIGSMERGPRMFGVRYGPCDRPSLDDGELVTEIKPAYDVANRYKTTETPETSHGSQMVLNQQLKLNANSNSPKLPSRSFYVKQNARSPEIAPLKRGIGESVPKQCPVPKAKIELPPYRPVRQTLKDDKCRRTNAIDMLYQKHLYCSVEKPMFESDPEILKASETYQLLLNTYVSLEAQRATAMRDIDKIGNLKHAAMKRPYKFIKQMKKGEIVFPQRQRVVKIPEVKLTHRNKELHLCHFKTPSGHMVAKPSEEFTKSTRLKKEPY